MNSRRSYRSLFTRKLAISSSLILLVFCVVVAVQAVLTHDEAIRQGKNIAERLTKIQTDHIELTFNEVNLTLKAEAKHYYYNSLFARPLIEDAEHNLKRWVSLTPPVSLVMITNKEGDLQISVSKKAYEDFAKAIPTLKDQDFFEYHKKNPAKKDDLSAITISSLNAPGTDKKMIVISQPLYNYDGSFSGVVAACIDAEYFFGFFRSLQVGKNISMGIMLNKKHLILSGSEDSVHKELFETNEYFKNRNFDVIEVSRAEADGKRYFVAAKKINSLDGIVTLGFDEDEILQGWRSDRLTDLVFLVLFTLFGAVLFMLILAMAKQIQKAEESEKNALLANQAKSEFLAKMSHELRTPLNAIIGFSEMMEHGYFGPLSNSKQQERMHDINLCGTHLLQLINDILDYTKGEAGKLEIYESEVAIPRAIDEAIKMVKEKAKRKNITIEQILPDDLPKILADERKIKQIFINLLTNAVKFTPGSGTVKIETLINKKGDLEVIVKDNGIGIPAEEIATALSVFGQVRGRGFTEEEGTGLGLPLCKMLTELHGGVFVLESEVGVGTTAIFTIPVSRIINKKTSAKKQKAVDEKEAEAVATDLAEPEEKE